MRSQSSSLWSQWWRIGGILGIGAVVLIAIGFVTRGMPPDLDTPIGEVRDYFTDNNTQYFAGGYLLGLGFVLLLLPFVVTLRGLLGWVEGTPKICSWLAFTGGVLMVAFVGAVALSWGALALGAAGDPDVSDSSVRTLMYVDAYGMTLFYLSGALLVLPASVIVLRTGVLWRWLGALGVVIGILAIVGTAWIIDGDQTGALSIIGLISFFGVLAWVLLVSVNMILKRELPDRAAS